jgi:hypothetical protein
MAKFTNPTVGARGVLLKDGAHQLIEAGETADIDEKLIADDGVHPDIEKGDAAAKKAADDKST